MPLHSLSHLTLGVPDVLSVASYYEDFGLVRNDSMHLSTPTGDQSLFLRTAPLRCLLELGVAASDDDDLARIERQLSSLDITSRRTERGLETVEPAAGYKVVVSIRPRLEIPAGSRTPYNGPGRHDRVDVRAAGVLRDDVVAIRKLGHIVVGSIDRESTERFFVHGLGFEVSDSIKDFATFMRCSTDHHNVFVQSAPLNFVHHTAWEVDDVDEIGRGAMNMLDGHPERHTWGPGRHHAGSNFFWYLRDPAGTFSEYYSDMDTIADAERWRPEVFDGPKGLFAWGPPPSPSFLAPDDLAELMAGTRDAV